MTNIMQFELSKEYLEHFKSALDHKDDDFIKTSLEGVKYADISDLLEEFNSEDAKYVLELIDRQVGADILSELEEDAKNSMLEYLTADSLGEFMNLMDSDDAVDLLSEMPIAKREDVIAHVSDQEKAAHILDLLRYEDDVAGGVMAKELIQVNVNWNVKQCIDEIRKQAEKVTKIFSVYVTNTNGKLMGRVSLKKIILATDRVKVSDIFDDDLISIETRASVEEVVSLMQKYDLEALPVVNSKGRLEGRITIDDAVDLITEQAEEDRQLMSGIAGDVEEDDSVWLLSKARLPWLVIGLAGGLLGAKFISYFEHDISIIPAMAFFIPLITATGGNVGIQSSTIVVQSLMNRNVFQDTPLQKIIKVLFVALINGIALSVLVFGIVMISSNDQTIAMTVAIALFSVVLLASFMGTVTPLLLDKMGINPALASGPFITTANDLLGLGVYFAVAHLLYGL